MKTIYPLKSKPKQKFPWRSFWAIIFLLSLFSIFYLFPNNTRSFFYASSMPFWSGRNFFLNMVSDTKEYFRTKASIISENIYLKNELDSLKLKQVDYDEILRENQKIKNIGEENLKQDRVISRVLSKPPISPYDTFVVSSGEKDGVVVGNKVYISNNTIVGIVKGVTLENSVVELFSNSGLKQEVTLTRTGTTYTIVGRGGGNFVLDVPKDTDIVWGDVFVFPDNNLSIIGNVYFIDSNSQSAFKVIYVKLPVNLFSIDWVSIER